MYQNALLNELRPLFLLQMILGWHPARQIITSKGLHLEIRLFSWQFFYSGIVLSLQLGNACYLFHSVLKSISLTKPEIQFLCYFFIIMKTFPDVSPILVIIQKPFQISFYNEWTALQSQIETCSISGKSLALKLKKQVFIRTIVIFFAVIIVLFIRSKNIAQVSAFHNIHIILSLIKEALVFSWWHYLCKALRNISSHLLREFCLMMEFNEEGKSNKLLTKAVLNLRSPWLQYFKLVQRSGSSLSVILSVIVIYSFFRLLFTAYIIITVADSRILNIFGGIFTTSTVALIVLCQATHNLQDGIHQDLLQALQCVKKLRINNTAKHEINDFLLHLLENRPEVTFSGYISAGRQLMMTVIAAFITYITVILQIQQISKSISFEQILEINKIIFS